MARSRSPAPATPSAAAETLAKLAHDVGKYLSRVARNLDPRLSSPPTGPLLAMLLADLYGPKAAPGQRPHAVFVALVQELPADFSDPRLSRCGDAFAALDALEAQVTQADVRAIGQAVRLALAIDTDLRDLARAHPVNRRVAPLRGGR